MVYSWTIHGYEFQESRDIFMILYQICAKIYTQDSYVTLLFQQNKCNVKNTFIAKHGMVTHMMINKNVHVYKIPYDVQSV